MSGRVDHMAEARKHIEWAHEQQSEEGKFEFTVRDNALIAQAEATLALVEQQRIANLVTLWVHDVVLIDDLLLDVVGDEIREALGLE